jgi:uncharacterized membrane protein
MALVQRQSTGAAMRTAIAFEPPAGQLGRPVARLWGEEPGKKAHDDLWAP